MQINSFANIELLNQYVTRMLTQQLSQAVSERGHAYLVVSGGKTPEPLFQTLAVTKLPWDKVICTLADERWISPTLPDSNEHMVRTCLLQQNAAQAQFISLYNEHQCLENAVTLTNERIGVLPQFDVVILGMGEDGHTASLFPDSAEIKTALSDKVNAVTFVKPRAAPYDRITLTKTRLLNTRSIYIYLVGEKKMAVLQEALRSDDELLMPIRAFLNHPEVNIQVMWAP